MRQPAYLCLIKSPRAQNWLASSLRSWAIERTFLVSRASLCRTTRTRTNTNPNDTKANAAGRRGVRVRSTNGMCENQGGRRRPSASKRERHLWVASTLEMHTGRRLTCGTRSFILAEVKNGFSAHRAPSTLPPGKMPLKGKNSFLSLQSDSETRGPQKSTSCQWAACGLADPPNHRAAP